MHSPKANVDAVFCMVFLLEDDNHVIEDETKSKAQKADTSRKPETSLIAHKFVIVDGCYTK